MDDTCAVCAETLEWVAYGQCGHREVCSTCIARLRFICDDRRCCLCKSESSIIFVTKALGDYTRMINDFSVFPADPTEGQVGPYWYHEGTQAFFDDLDHSKMIKAMCRLSCIVCDKMDEQRNEGSKRRGNFRSIEQLKSHLFHRHKLLMCSLCLEGRKIFICEQKLYGRAQLNQHINTGDSEVDGSESERGGFMGHPICEFCRNPFYGDNELYSHMSTEHYTCHICQRQHPGQFEYYRNYDDLEIHFRREHLLCEDEACLAKKFIVFATESEMKRHNTMEHGGRMSRSKRSAALQIPTSFRYRRNSDQDRRGRGRGFRLDSSDTHLSLAIEASLETANADISRATSSNAQAYSDPRETSEVDSFPGSFGILASADSEPSTRYRQVVGQNSRNTPLEESSFPPLPVAKRSSQRKSRNDSEGLRGNTMAAHLRRRNNGAVKVLNSSQAWPAASRQPTSSMSSTFQSRPISNSGRVLSSGSASSFTSKPATHNGLAPSNYANSGQSRHATANGLLSATSASSSRNTSSANKVSHSASAPTLLDRGSFDPSTSNFPPVSATQTHKVATSSQPLPKVGDVHTANKSLVDRIRAALEFDEDKYTAFKEITTEYRKGLIDTGEYLAYVHQFGLSHLVLELARLCPDAQKQKELLEAQKQKELLEAYNNSLRSNSPHENGSGSYSGQSKGKKGSKKGKEKCEDNGISGSKAALADSIVSSVRGLQSNYKHSEGEVEILSKDGYRATKGKSKVLVVDEKADSSSANQTPAESRMQNHSESAGGDSKNNMGTGGGGNKQRKKTSKFHRVRLGDSSPAALLDLTNSDPGPDLSEEKTDGNREDPPEGLPVRGVWQNGGGRRLVSMTQRDPIN